MLCDCLYSWATETSILKELKSVRILSSPSLLSLSAVLAVQEVCMFFNAGECIKMTAVVVLAGAA